MFNIRRIAPADKAMYLEMTKEFYSSEAVIHALPEEHYLRTFDELMRSDVYAECYIFELDEAPAGYALLAKTFSQEAGGLVCWIEELYIREEFRGKGAGRAFFASLEKELSGKTARMRLELEPDNTRAEKLYKKMGFQPLEYAQMVKELETANRD